MKKFNWIFDASRIRNAKVYNGLGNETDEPAPLEDKLDMLLEALIERDETILELYDALDENQVAVWNHRHSVGKGLYSGRGEK